MLKKALVGSGILIGMYVVFTNWVGFDHSVAAASSGASGVAKTLQGR